MNSLVVGGGGQNSELVHRLNLHRCPAQTAAKQIAAHPICTQVLDWQLSTSAMKRMGCHQTINLLHSGDATQRPRKGLVTSENGDWSKRSHGALAPERHAAGHLERKFNSQSLEYQRRSATRSKQLWAAFVCTRKEPRLRSGQTCDPGTNATVVMCQGVTSSWQTHEHEADAHCSERLRGHSLGRDARYERIQGECSSATGVAEESHMCRAASFLEVVKLRKNSMDMCEKDQSKCAREEERLCVCANPR